MVDPHPAFGQHLFEVAEAHCETQVPAHGPQDHLGRDAKAAERACRGHTGTLAQTAAFPTSTAGLNATEPSYWSGLFHCNAVPGLPRTNNGLEQLFGSQRYHERRAAGRKAASPAAVVRGEVRLVAATATRLRLPEPRELGRVNLTDWRAMRRRLDQRRRARTLRTRFRRDPDAYLAELEQQAYQLTLPT